MSKNAVFVLSFSAPGSILTYVVDILHRIICVVIFLENFVFESETKYYIEKFQISGIFYEQWP